MSSPEPDLPDELIQMGLLDSDSDIDSSEESSVRKSMRVTRPSVNTIIEESECSNSLSGSIVDFDGDDSFQDETYVQPRSESENESGVESLEDDQDPEVVPEVVPEDVPEVVPEVDQTQLPVVEKTRKRKRTPKSWKRNVKKAAREGGEVYEGRDGKVNRARTSSCKCLNGCTFQCMNQINEEERKIIFRRFWKLSDEKKLHFYAKFVVMKPAARKRTKGDSLKKNTFEYYFELSGDRIRVCREFFLSLLDIDKARIYYFFKTKFNVVTSVASTPTKGKHVKKVINPHVVTAVENHIKSFPCVESHYCRSTSTKMYLPQGLNIAKMYDMYLVSDFVINSEPVKSSFYRHIFNTKFNFGFFQPKKDRCDLCEAYKHVANPTQLEQEKHEKHLLLKQEGKIERDLDRENTKTRSDDNSAVLSFDMQNVFALPKAEISNFFYRRKFNCYNLTAHCSIDGVTYCAFWHEAMSGRAGNHIASALSKILYTVSAAHPQIKKIILWSDSCVPQNRNSVMSTAIKHFLNDDNVNVEIIEQKFSETGHGLIQEVDSVHSKIERGLRNSEIFSPVDLLRKLLLLRPGNAPLKIIQMKANDFFNFQQISSYFLFNQVPYTKVKHLIYNANYPHHMSYRLSFSAPEITVRIKRQATPRSGKTARSGTSPSSLFCSASVINDQVQINAEKAKDIKAMFQYMSQIDVVFYKTILK